MVQKVRRRLRLGLYLWLVCILPAQPGAGQRLVVVTLDGLGHEILTSDPVAAELTVLHDTIRAGVLAEGVQAPRPALTAVSHASIWTGAGPEVNGVAFNNPPASPRSEHRATETVNGFRGTRLLAEPFWVAAGRQGVKSLAIQPTQGFPFTPVNTGAGATVINSYQTRAYAPYAIYKPRDVAWKADGEFTFKHGAKNYRAKPVEGGLEIGPEAGGGMVVVPPAAVESEPPNTRELGRHFRPVVLDGGETGLYFRLYSYDGKRRQVRLLATAAHETGWHDGVSRRLHEVQAMVNECGPVLINGATALLNSGEISEAEYLETVELVIRQLTRHAAWAVEHVSPRLAQGYLPYPDEFDHQWIALARSGQGRFAEFRRWGYIALNRGMAVIASLAGDSDWLMWASDHGMAEIRQSVSIPEVLARAGLEEKAILLYNSILINTDDWSSGVVPKGEKAEVLRRVRRELEQLRDPESGKPVVRDVHTGKAAVPRCESCGDLYFDLMPGYRTSARREARLITPIKPVGAHGFAPWRADMLAIFTARGPGIAPGSAIKGMRTIDIAPMISGLLNIQPPRQSKGRRPPVEIRSSR